MKSNFRKFTPKCKRKYLKQEWKKKKREITYEDILIRGSMQRCNNFLFQIKHIYIYHKIKNQVKTDIVI